MLPSKSARLLQVDRAFSQILGILPTYRALINASTYKGRVEPPMSTVP